MTAYTKKGFTLIELLIVMAILGVLAVVVLVAINPVQQLARTRDSGRKSSITQLGHAMEAYFTAHNGEYLDATNCIGANGGPLATLWMGCLVAAGEMSSAPSTITNSVGTSTPVTCNLIAGISGHQNQWCYNVNGGATAAVLFTVLESATEQSKCPAQNPYFIWNTADGRGGTVCMGDGTAPAAGGSFTYLED